MPDQTIPLPPTEQIVGEKNLQQALMGSYLDTGSYVGSRNPGAVWYMMSRMGSGAIPHYRELEDKDDDINSALDELKLSVLEREWTVSPGDASPAALEASDFAQAQLNGVDFEAAMDHILDAAPYGFSVAELMYDVSMGQVSLISIDDCPQELFLFGPRYYPQVGPMQLLSMVGSSDGTLVPEDKFAIFSYRGRARSRTGRPLLKSAFWPSWFKRNVLGMWLRTGEKANGTAISRYADTASEAEKQLAVQCSEAIMESSAAAIPANMVIEIELLKATQKTDVAIYEKLFTQQQYSIARAIKGETLTSFGNEGGRGSNAQGQTHADTFDKRSVSLAKKAGAVVTKQMLYRLHLWNFGPQIAAPVFAYDTAEEQDLTRKGTEFSMAQRLGIPIPGKWAAAELQIPAATEEDPALVPNINAPMATPPNAAFSETGDLVDQDYAQFDQLVAQLRRKALTLSTERVDEIVDALRPR